MRPHETEEVIPGTFKVQGLIDFFRTAPRQKPYSTQVRYISHCDIPNRLWCVNVSHQGNRINCALVYPDVQKQISPFSHFSLPIHGRHTFSSVHRTVSCDNPP